VRQFDGRGNAFLQNSAVPQMKRHILGSKKIKLQAWLCPETFILKIKSKHNSFTKFSHCQQVWLLSTKQQQFVSCHMSKWCGSVLVHNEYRIHIFSAIYQLSRQGKMRFGWHTEGSFIACHSDIYIEMAQTCREVSTFTLVFVVHISDLKNIFTAWQ